MSRMFSEMLKAARLWLADREPWDIARKAGVQFDGSSFSFLSLGIAVTVFYPDYHITPQLDPWHQLIILHYLHLADGMPLTGQLITFAQQKDGMVRGGGFDRKAERIISRLDMECLKERCAAMGGREKKAGADYSATLPLLPMYPVTLNYWQPDEEFSASGRLLLDASAEHYLTVEDSVVAGDLLLEMLNKQPTRSEERTNRT